MTGSPALAARLGISYRRVHHVAYEALARRTGSGRHLRWTDDEVARWHAAVALDQAHPHHSPAGSILHRAVTAAFDGPHPPARGWAILTGNAIHYATDDHTLAAHLTHGGLVARYDTTPATMATAA